MSDDVVVPIRMGRGASFGGNHHELVPIADIGNWINTFLLALCPNRMQKKQSFSSKMAANLAGVSSKLINDCLVPMGLIAHQILLKIGF
jgi:hypothetical protein